MDFDFMNLGVKRRRKDSAWPHDADRVEPQDDDLSEELEDQEEPFAEEPGKPNGPAEETPARRRRKDLSSLAGGEERLDALTRFGETNFLPDPEKKELEFEAGKVRTALKHGPAEDAAEPLRKLDAAHRRTLGPKVAPPKQPTLEETTHLPYLNREQQAADARRPDYKHKVALVQQKLSRMLEPSAAWGDAPARSLVQPQPQLSVNGLAQPLGQPEKPTDEATAAAITKPAQAGAADAEAPGADEGFAAGLVRLARRLIGAGEEPAAAKVARVPNEVEGFAPGDAEQRRAAFERGIANARADAAAGYPGAVEVAELDDENRFDTLTDEILPSQRSEDAGGSAADTSEDQRREDEVYDADRERRLRGAVDSAFERPALDDSDPIAEPLKASGVQTSRAVLAAAARNGLPSHEADSLLEAALPLMRRRIESELEAAQGVFERRQAGPVEKTGPGSGRGGGRLWQVQPTPAQQLQLELLQAQVRGLRRDIIGLSPGYREPAAASPQRPTPQQAIQSIQTQVRTLQTNLATEHCRVLVRTSGQRLEAMTPQQQAALAETAYRCVHPDIVAEHLSGPYRIIAPQLRWPFEANHPNQTGVFPMIGRSRGLSHPLMGGANSGPPGPHGQYHMTIEQLLERHRPGGAEFGRRPSTREFSKHAEQGLLNAGLPEGQVLRLLEQMRREQSRHGLGQNDPIPRVPGAVRFPSWWPQR